MWLLIDKGWGGLALFWKEDVDLTVLHFSMGHISVVVRDDFLGAVGYIFGFYGHPEVHLRSKS